MGILDSLMGALTGEPGKRASEENMQRWREAQTQGMGYLDNGLAGSNKAIDSAKSAYGSLGELAKKYGGGTSLYLDSLGVNGADGNQRAQQAFQAGPGYQYAVDQSLDGIMRKSAALGGLGGGNTLTALTDRAGAMANQEYAGWQNSLQGLINPELSATSGFANGQAGAELARSGVYQTDAGNRVNLLTGATKGINGENTAGANAEMAGGANMLGLGMNLAKLGTGLNWSKIGTSLLGG